MHLSIYGLFFTLLLLFSLEYYIRGHNSSDQSTMLTLQNSYSSSMKNRELLSFDYE